MKETLKEMEDRHRREFQQFCRQCKHKTVLITEGIDGMESPIKTHTVDVVGSLNSRSLVIRCAECGTPLFSMTQGKVDFANGLVTPEKPKLRGGKDEQD